MRITPPITITSSLSDPYVVLDYSFDDVTPASYTAQLLPGAHEVEGPDGSGAVGYTVNNGVVNGSYATGVSIDSGTIHNGPLTGARIETYSGERATAADS